MEAIPKDLEAQQYAVSVERLECRVASGDPELLRCWADLSRPLTQEEQIWFQTADPGLYPSPDRFLFRDASVHFLCEPEEKSQWIVMLEKYLQQAWEQG